MKKIFVLTTVLVAAILGALFLAGCEDLTSGNGKDNSADGTKMTWTGSWIKDSDTKYTSNSIGDSANTIERLVIEADGAGTLTIQIIASSSTGDYGYASKLDRGVSASDYQMRVTGTDVATYTYNIPAGSHWIQFMYQKDNRYVSRSDNVTVEIISSSFTSSSTNTTTRLKVQNESSFDLADVKWGSAVIAASLAAAESKTVDVSEGTGYLYFTKGDVDGLKCRTQDVIAMSANETKELVITNNTIVVALDDTSNVQALGTMEERTTRLTVNNQSFTELTNVLWNNVSFANNTTDNSVKTGTSVTEAVSKGEGYIFFGRKTSPITARTKSLVSVEEYASQTFTFADATEIVEVNNPDNTGTLGTLQSTVIFWDDAEGELQPYYESASFVGYYATSSDLLYNSSYNNFNPPKNGQKSIAVGGTITAKLHLRITLSKAAKLSFWYANKYRGTAGTTFSINGTTERTWTTDVNWSKLEFDLAAGVNDLVWEKKDGYSSSFYYYLTLDDILIYYTE
jgi:hypothetical protein